MRIDITTLWYRPSIHPLLWVLLPFSWLFAVVVKFKNWLYSKGLLRTQHFKIPIIVVGNITVGGTGKTPFVIWLATLLQTLGYTPGIVSRGVGGIRHRTPYRVQAQDKANIVGDEAILLSQHTNCPVVIGMNRAEAVRTLLASTACDIVISDDGLQHTRLGRDIEIMIVDGKRRFGNGCLLPAGPLRESTARLQHVDFVVINAGNPDDLYTMSLQPKVLIAIKQQQQIDLNHFPQRKIHAVAGIGHPEQFFQSLEQAGFEVIRHVFPDHYAYRAADLKFNDALPIVMTEKDAVKCKEFADERYWYLTITAKLNEAFEKKLLATLKPMKGYEHDQATAENITHHVSNDVPFQLGKSDS